MPLPVLVIPVMVLAAQAAAPSRSIVVTGRPWAPFISPMGEPFRARTSSDDTLAMWFRQADRNHDGALTVDEMRADADRFFATLDANHDGEIDPDELMHYEAEVAPEIQVVMRTMRKPGEPPERKHRDRQADGIGAAMGFGGALQGAARYGLLNMPEPVAAADTDFDRGVSLEEFRLAAARRFQLLDSGRTGKLTLPQLEAMREIALSKKGRSKNDDDDGRVGNGLPPEN